MKEPIKLVVTQSMYDPNMLSIRLREHPEFRNATELRQRLFDLGYKPGDKIVLTLESE